MENEKILVNGSALKRIRKTHGITQKEMAKNLNLKQSTYSNYENGYNNPPEEIIRKFCEILNENPDDFRIAIEEHFECKVMDSDFKEVRSFINSINNRQLRRKLIFEFGDLMEGFKKRIETEVLNGEK